MKLLDGSRDQVIEVTEDVERAVNYAGWTPEEKIEGVARYLADEISTYGPDAEQLVDEVVKLIKKALD